MSQRVSVYSLSKLFWSEGVAKASVKSAILLYAEDPKPSELVMARVKSRESGAEARTREPCNTLG